MKALASLGFLLLLLMIPAAAYAGPITLTQGSFTATVDVVGTTATLTFGSGLNSFITDQVAIHAANGAIVTGGSSSGSGWTIQNGQNSVNCDGAGNWFCAVASSNQSFNGLTFSWNFTGGTLTDLRSIQFAVCNTSTTANCGPGSSNFVTNFSQNGVVPEPASLTLLGMGLLAIGHRTWRRKLGLSRD